MKRTKEEEDTKENTVQETNTVQEKVTEDSIAELQHIEKLLSAHYKKIEESQKAATKDEEKEKELPGNEEPAKSDSILKMMDFAKKLEQGFRLKAKTKKFGVVPYLQTHPLFQKK